MSTEFKLPELGENISSGDLVRMLVKQGESISEGQAVMELETDKAVIEVPSSVTGKVQDIRVKEGQKVTFEVVANRKTGKASAENLQAA